MPAAWCRQASASPSAWGAGASDAHDQPYKLLVVPAERILAEEPALLDEARQAMSRIPFPSLDVLVIDEIGKNISGDGADPNITGRYPTPYASGGPQTGRARPH